MWSSAFVAASRTQKDFFIFTGVIWLADGVLTWLFGANAGVWVKDMTSYTVVHVGASGVELGHVGALIASAIATRPVSRDRIIFAAIAGLLFIPSFLLGWRDTGSSRSMHGFGILSGFVFVIIYDYIWPNYQHIPRKWWSMVKGETPSPELRAAPSRVSVELEVDQQPKDSAPRPSEE